MYTVSEAAQLLGIKSKQTVRNHMQRLGRWSSVSRNDAGTALLTDEDLSALAASVAKAKAMPCRKGGRKPAGPTKAELAERVAELERRISVADGLASGLREELAGLDGQRRQLASDLDEARRELAEARLEAFEAKGRAEGLSRELAEARAALREVEGASIWRRLRGFKGLLPPGRG